MIHQGCKDRNLQLLESTLIQAGLPPDARETLLELLGEKGVPSRLIMALGWDIGSIVRKAEARGFAKAKEAAAKAIAGIAEPPCRPGGEVLSPAQRST